MNQYNDQTKTLIEAWEAVVRYRWRFILASFGVTAGLMIGSFLLPRKYKATAIFERHTDMVMNQMIDQGGSKSFLDSQRQSLVEEIAGQIAIDEMIQTLKSSRESAQILQGENSFDLDNLRSDLSRRVTVKFDIGTREFDRIRVEFLHANPKMARAVVNVLVENYLDRTRRLINGRLEQTASFFQSEVERSRRLIEELENKKLTFEIDHAELLPDYPGGIQIRLNQAQADLAEQIQKRDATAMRISALRELITSTPEVLPQIVTSRNPHLDILTSKLQDLNQKKESYIDVYKMTDKHPDLVVIKEQIASTQQEIADTPTEIVTEKRMSANLKRDSLELELSQATTLLQTTDKQIDTLKDVISRFNVNSSQLFPVRADYRKLSRKIDQTQRQLTFWEENLRRVQMAVTAESGNRGIRLDFVKPCPVIYKPVSPNLVQVLMLTISLGLAAGGINVFFAYRTDDTFRTGEQLAETLNVTLAGTVSEIISNKQRAERRLRNTILYPINASAMAAVLILVLGLLYLNLEKPHLFKQLKDNPTSFIRQQLNNSRIDAAVVIPQE